MRSKVPTEDVPIVLYVPIAYLHRLGARLAGSSYVVVFKGVPWDYVRSAWYQERVEGKWERSLAKGVANHLIKAPRYSNRIATKNQIIERAKEVIAECTRRDENIRSTNLSTPRGQKRSRGM